MGGKGMKVKTAGSEKTDEGRRLVSWGKGGGHFLLRLMRIWE
ncbi:MAG: hypothetical protein RIS92_653 [Verrucomicrobiota bacterium]|jgi:hypothetical protein